MVEISSSVWRITNALETEGKLEESVQVFVDAYKADPKCTVALYQAARVLRKLGRLRDAINCIDEAVRAGKKEHMLFREMRAEEYASVGMFERTVKGVILFR